MKKLTDGYDKLDRQVCALEIFAVVLFCMLAGYAIYLVYIQRIDDALKVSIPLGALISAMLVAKVASRLLAHNVIVRVDDRRQDMVRVTHHLLIIISELQDRVGYAIGMFRDGEHPLIALIENVAAIEKRYEALLDREVYRFISGETINLIGGMRGYVFGLAVLAKGLDQGKPNTIIPASDDPTRKKMIESLESLLKDLDVLDMQIRQLRRMLEPVNNQG